MSLLAECIVCLGSLGIKLWHRIQCWKVVVTEYRATRIIEEVYRGSNKGLHVMLSMTLAGPGRTVKQEQEEISRNHIQTFICLSVHLNVSLTPIS